MLIIIVDEVLKPDRSKVGQKSSVDRVEPQLWKQIKPEDVMGVRKHFGEEAEKGRWGSCLTFGLFLDTLQYNTDREARILREKQEDIKRKVGPCNNAMIAFLGKIGIRGVKVGEEEEPPKDLDKVTGFMGLEPLKEIRASDIDVFLTLKRSGSDVAGLINKNREGIETFLRTLSDGAQSEEDSMYWMRYADTVVKMHELGVLTPMQKHEELPNPKNK